MTDAGGSQSYIYDAAERLVRVTRGPTSFAYSYDPAGRLQQRVYPDGTAVGLGIPLLHHYRRSAKADTATQMHIVPTPAGLQLVGAF